MDGVDRAGDDGNWNGVEEAAPIDYALVGRIQAEVNRALDERARAASTAFSPAEQRQLAGQLISEYLESQMLSSAEDGLELLDAVQERALRDAVLAQMFGLGRLEQLLLDTEIEDIRIPGSGPVLVKLASGVREIRDPVAESVSDLMAQLDAIATHHGQNARSVTSARPWLDLRLPGQHRLAGVWEITPKPYVTVRRHRYVDITLDDLVEMGELSPAMAAFLKAAVIARRSILVVGGQSSGKTTLLRGLCQCLPPTESFATLETEYELLLHEIAPDRFPWLIPYEAREGMGEIGLDGRPAGEVTLADIFPTSLRHSLDRMVVGEVRGQPTLGSAERGPQAGGDPSATGRPGSMSMSMSRGKYGRRSRIPRSSTASTARMVLHGSGSPHRQRRPAPGAFPCTESAAAARSRCRSRACNAAATWLR